MASHGQLNTEAGSGLNAASAHQSGTQAPANAHGDEAPGSAPSAAESDEHYNRYLQERDAMMQSQAPGKSSTAAQESHGERGNADVPGILAQAKSGADDQTRRDAVDELLKSLGQSRTS